MAPPIEKDVNNVRKTLEIEPITMTKSNIFHPSLKYNLSMATIFIIASRVNIAVKM